MNAKELRWVYLLGLALVWGSSYILIKKGLVGLTAVQLGSLRIIFASMFLAVFGFKSLSKIPKASWKHIIITAFIGTFFPAYLFAIAETEIDSSITGVLNSAMPLITLSIGVIGFGLGVQRRQIWGIVFGLIGSVLLVYSGMSSHPGQNYFYACYVVMATFCYALNVNLIKHYLSNVPSLSITTGNFVVLIIPALLILFSTNFAEAVLIPQVQYSMAFIAILGIVGTGIANILFFKLIQISTPVFASSVTYLIPIVACMWGFLDGEVFSPNQLIGAAVVLIGVFLSAKR